MTIRRFYFTCTCGRFHDSVSCPTDGSSCPEAQDIIRGVTRLASAGQFLSIERLRAEGISAEALRYVVVAEFGDERCSFDELPWDNLGWQRRQRRDATTHSQVDVRLYLQCSGCDGDDALYSRLDVWSSPESKDIASAAERLKSTGRAVSIEGLRAGGIPESALRRLIVVEFGGEWATFQFMHIHPSA